MQNLYLDGLVENWSMAGSMMVCRDDKEKRKALEQGETGTVCVILEISLRPGAEHRLPVFRSCIWLSAVDPIIKDFSSKIKSIQVLTVIDSLRGMLSLQGIWRN